MKNLEKTRQDIAKKQNRLQAEAETLAKKINAAIDWKNLDAYRDLLVERITREGR